MFIARCVIQAHGEEPDTDLIADDIKGTLQRMFPEREWECVYDKGVMNIKVRENVDVDFHLKHTGIELAW